MDELIITNDTSVDEALIKLIDFYGLDRNSDTPNYLLANYMLMAIGHLGMTVRKRDEFHNFKPIRAESILIN